MTSPKRRPGRPALPAKDRRDRTVAARFTADELEMLEARAEQAGVPVAVFVRLSAVDAARA